MLNEFKDAALSFDDEVLRKNKAIKDAEEFSKEKLESIRTEVRANPPSEECSVLTLAVAGSLARLEASSMSDLDLLMALNSSTAADEDQETSPL